MATGSGTGTPLPGPVITGSSYIEPLPFTKMSIFDWARRLGLNPVHFAGGHVSGKYVEHGTCQSIWTRYAWQSYSQVSHMDVAAALVKSEELIEDYLGYHVAPAIRTDTYQYPRYQHRHRMNMVDLSGRRPAVQVNRGHVSGVGILKRDLIDTQSLSYRDVDGDGFNEIAELTVTTPYPANEIQIYPRGFAYHPSFQIRHPRAHYSSQVGTVTFIIDFWHLVKPDIQARTPGVLPESIDMGDANNLITEVDIYRVWLDSTDTDAVTFYWEPSPGFDSNGETTAQGLGFIRDTQSGLIAPSFPNPTTTGLCSDNNMSPDRVKITYMSGVVSQEYLDGMTLNPLDRHLADAVFYLATARITRDLCGCNNAHSLSAELRQDMALVSPEGNFLAVADKIQEAPFGTRRGEWLAYQEIKLAAKHIEVAMI